MTQQECAFSRAERMDRKDREIPQPAPAVPRKKTLTGRPSPGPPPVADSFRQYMQQVLKFPRLTREEEQELTARYRERGDPEAAYKLVTGNLRLVVKIAFQYRRAFLNMLDLVQEGNIGLLQAVKKYDPFRGVPFSAYAAWWIRAYILKHLLDHWSIVRVGTTNARRRLFFNLKKEKERLEREGITPGPKMLAETFETTEEDVMDVSRALSQRDLSLDAPVTEDSNRNVGETIPVAGESLDETIAQEELRSMLREKMATFAETLKERERFTFQKRLVAEDPLTLQQIGDEFGITREAVRLIEKKVVKRLREHLRTELTDLSLFEVTDDEAEAPPELPPAHPRSQRKPSKKSKQKAGKPASKR